MIRRLPVVIGALAFASSLGVAQADHIRISGGVRWSGGVHVGTSWHFARPAYRPYYWGVRGSIYVGPSYYYYPRPYYVYYPTYVPSYYATTSYYPVEAQAQGPSTVAPAPAPRPPLAKFGIGLFAGGTAIESQDGGSMHESDDLGLTARFRLTPGLILEGELGKNSFTINGVEDARVDRRLGASLLYEIGAYNRFAPFLLAGMGVNQAEVGGMYETTQSYGELGAGLRFAVTPKFHLAADFRVGSRDTVSDNQDQVPAGSTARTITPPPDSSTASEEYTRARLQAILYF